jgi:hypothetical protein
MIDADKEHESVFSPATLSLGRVHWYVMRAATLMRAKTEVYTKPNGSHGLTFVQQATTEFAKDVGRDEIDWWIRRKEKDLDELRAQTVRALEAVQTLTRASDALTRNRFGSYPELLAFLRQFAERHSTEVEVLHGYVRWLAERDILAPHILFTYRVWGSTRRGERWIDVREIGIEEEESQHLRRLTEVVLGLSSGMLYAVDRAEYEIGAEIADQMDPENMTGEIRIPVTSIVKRASHAIFHECAVYFRELRDSLRNIILDIDKHKDEERLIHSDRFWRDFISKAVRTQKAEPQFWDFKETLTMWVAQGDGREKGKVGFAEEVASLANAEGGVLVIGVTDQRGVVGIGGDVESRLKFASDVLARHLEYDRNIVTFHQVEVSDNADVKKLCLVVIVAKACGPVGVRQLDGSYSYPIRRETGITRESRLDIANPKTHLKSDSYEFLDALKQFVRDSQ